MSATSHPGEISDGRRAGALFHPPAAYEMVSALGLPEVVWYSNQTMPIGFSVLEAMNAIHAGMVAVNDRTNAGSNPLAVRRDPITMDDYLAAPMVRHPRPHHARRVLLQRPGDDPEGGLTRPG